MGERVVLPIKAFIDSDFEILIFFALSNLTIAVKFLTERKRRYILIALYMCIRVPFIVSHRKLPT